MKLRFPWARWLILVAINVQCVSIYLRVGTPKTDVRHQAGFGLNESLGWWIAMGCAIFLWNLPGTSIDRFGRAVMMLAAVYCAMLASIIQWSSHIDHTGVMRYLALVSVACQVCSAVLLISKMRGRM
jgi:hypothetical protein